MTVPAELYQKWLNDPITKAVFANGEQMARPALLDQQLPNESEASYRLGFTSGAFYMLDALRSLAPMVAPELEADYGAVANEGEE